MSTGHPAWMLRLALPGLLLAALFVAPAHAAVNPDTGTVAVATSPLFNAASVVVKPNLLFMLDDSSSMGYNYLPDEVPKATLLLGNPDPWTDSHTVALTSSQCNGVAYNPALTYTPPVTFDNTAMPTYSYRAAPNNGFVTGSGTTDLIAQWYYVYNGVTVGGVTTKQTPLSYTYISGVVDPTTTFYQECNLLAASIGGKFTKVLVNGLSTANKQNYSNWYTYYRTRMLMMKTLTGQSFQALNTNFRVGLSTAHDTGAIDTSTFLPIDDFSTAATALHPSAPFQKELFFNKLYAMSVNAGAVPQKYTPLRGAMSKAGRLFAGKFATTVPGTTPAEQALDPMQYSCQQNFTLLASDGYWNSSDDTATHTALKLDDLTPVGDQDSGSVPAPFFDNLARPNSLADVTMYYYQTDLRHPDNCTSAATGENLCPLIAGVYTPNVPGTSFDNMVTPHMTTMTLGLAINGLLGYSPSYQTDTSGDYFLIKNGTKNWPDPRTLDPVSGLGSTFPYDGTIKRQVIERVDDMWHAAVNGRGTYFNARNPTTLVQGLKGALAGIASRLGYGNAGATSSLAPTAGDNALYVASYTTSQWTGNLVAESINVNTGMVNPTATWCVEDLPADPILDTAACVGRLRFQVGATPASDSRTIYFNNASTLTSFTYTNLPAGLKGYFDNTKLSQYTTTWSAADKLVASGDTLVNFLRGQSQYESQDGSTANLYRKRLARLGDIVDTQPVFLGKPFYAFTDPGYAAFKTTWAGRARTVFVSGNDGMLHAFNATTGDERWAFVPTTVMPSMYWLADLTYATNHHNYANGRIAWSDVCYQSCTSPSARWKTILIAGLNGGGRGYYALDVTDPTAPVMLWEFTSLNDADMGYSFGNPLAVKLSNGNWVVLVSSGYDNVTLGNGDPYDKAGTGRGFLWVLDPLDGHVIRKIDTGVGSATDPSGLAKIGYWADSPEIDATAVFAYGGDLQGNLWRFDINNGNVVRLATFTDVGGVRQPITTRPEMTKVGVNRMIFASTGKYLEQADLDPAKFKTQSLYAIVDNGTTVADPRALAMRTLTSARPIRTVTKDDKDPALGWFVDFPDSGERSNVDMVLARGTLLVPTNVPTNTACDAGGYSWLNFLDYKSGDSASGASSAAVWMGNALTTGLNVLWINRLPTVIATDQAHGPKLVPEAPFKAGAGAAGVIGHRIGWREIVPK